MQTVIFYFLAAVCVISSFLVVTRRNAIAAALFLVVTMTAIAGLFVQLGTIFLAALQVIVYAGAVMVLFLFVIMLLDLRRDEFGFDRRVFQRLMAFLLAGLFLVQLVVVVIAAWHRHRASLSTSALMGNVPLFSTKLFYQYLYPFEIISVLLLAAIVGTVVIARRRKET